jgi:hypothetical protein
MSSQKIVRCQLRKAGNGSPGQVRYVPLEIFGLWEHLMSSKHGFQVMDPRASLWLDMEDSPEAAYAENQFDRVTEVTAFVYSQRDDMFTRARRYFRSDEAEDLKRIFLALHRRGAHQTQSTSARIWIVREAIAGGKARLAAAAVTALPAGRGPTLGRPVLPPSSRIPPAWPGRSAVRRPPPRVPVKSRE